MIVYKILEKNDKYLKSIYYYFIWNIGETYEQKINVRDFPAYSTPSIFVYDKKAADGIQGISKEDLLHVREGFHSFDTIERAYCTGAYSEVVVQCTIPKGSTYYKDTTGLLVSNRLRVDKIIEEHG